MKIFILLITLLCSALVAGQSVLDIEADYVNFIDGDFYVYQKKDDNYFNIYEVTFKNSEAVLEFSELILKDSITYHELIDVRKNNNLLQSITKKEEINGEYFYEDYEQIGTLKLDSSFNMEFVLNLEDEKTLLIEEVKHIERIAIKINSTYVAYLLIIESENNLKRQYGLIYKTEKGLFYNGNKLFIDNKFELDQNQLNKILRSWYNYIDNEILFDDKNNVDLKILENNFDIKLDSVSHSFTGNFIVGYFDEELIVLNSWLKDITPKSFTDIDYFNSNNLQILDANILNYLNIDGEISEHVFPYDIYGCGLTSYDTMLKIEKDSLVLKYMPDVIYSKYSVKSNNSIDQDDVLVFPNEMRKVFHKKDSSSVFSLLSGGDSQLTIFENYLGKKNNYIVQRTNKDGVFLTSFYLQIVSSSNSDKVKYDLVFDYDNCKRYDDLIYSDKGQTVIVQLKGLKGYLGINDKPKYKTLEPFQGNYARFEYPDGRKGWLKLDGTEFIDQ